MSQSVADRLDADTGREWSDAEVTELPRCSCAASRWRRSRDFCAGITARSGIKLPRWGGPVE
jgi:hypothetical protein